MRIHAKKRIEREKGGERERGRETQTATGSRNVNKQAKNVF